MKTPEPEKGVLREEDFPRTGPVPTAEEAAALWVARLTSGETTAEERAEFARWRAADPAHEAALTALRGLWIGLDRMLVEAAAAASSTAQTRPARGGRRWRIWALAASLLLACVLVLQAATDWRHDAVTAAGERRSIDLADGSRVTLSGATALDVRFDESRRGISLARGEAYFDVVPDPGRPFVIEAGRGSVHVLGTRFAVRRQAQALSVTVEHGRVELRAGGGVAVVLGDGQRLTLGDGAPPEVVAVDAARELSWRQGRLIVSDATLDEIARALKPHYRGVLIVVPTAGGARRLNAVIDLERIDDWLTGLERTESVRLTRLGPLVIVR